MSTAGFVVGFSEKPFADESPHRRLVRVHYRKSRPSKETFDQITLDELLYTKSVDWRYEREWRYIDSRVSANGDGHQNQRYPFRFDPSKVREVVIGARAKDDFKRKLLECLSSDDYQHVEVLQAEPDDQHYQLRLVRPPFRLSRTLLKPIDS